MSKPSSLFNVPLYIRMLRRLRKLGVTLWAVTAGASALLALLSRYAWNISSITSISQISPLLTLYMYIGPTSLTLYAFSYLRKRNESDFFHSVPVRKSAMYLAGALAVMSYVTASVITSILLIWVCFLASGISFIGLYLPLLVLTYICGSILAMGCALLGVCLTGNIFNNIVVTMLFMFLPRTLLLMCTFVIEGIVPMTSPAELGMLLNPGTNLLSALILTPFGFNNAFLSPDAATLMQNAGTLIYTATLGVIYFLCGLYIYRKRRSEVAGSNAITHGFRHICRCAISVPFVMCAAVMVALSIYRGSLESTTAWTAAVLLFVSLAVYIVYESITVRSLKSMSRSMAMYPLLLIVSALLALLSVGIGILRLNTTFTPSDLEGVRISFAGSGDSIYNVKSHNYNDRLSARLIYRDETTLELVCSMLKENIAIEKGEKSSAKGENVSVEFVKRGVNVNRVLVATEEDIAKLKGQIGQCADYRAAVTALPLEEKISLKDCELLGGATQEASELWDTLREELAALDYESRKALAEDVDKDIPGRQGKRELHSFGTFNIGGINALDFFYNTYPLTVLTEQSTNAVLQDVYAQNTARILQTLEYLDKYALGDTDAQDYLEVNVSFIDGGYDVGETYGIYAYAGERADDSQRLKINGICKYVRAGLENEPDISGMLCYVQVRRPVKGMESVIGYDTSYIYINITAEDEQMLRGILE